MRRAVLVLCLALAGCATPYDPEVDLYDISDRAQVTKDETDCGQYAADYKRPFNTSGVAVSGAQGVGSNLGLGVTAGSTFQPLAPLLGGLGGILVAGLQWLGLVDADRPRAFQQCMLQRLSKDHAATLVEPPL